MKKILLSIGILLIIIIGGFLWMSGQGEYQSSRENEERMRIRKEELGRVNPDLLAKLEKNIEALEIKVRENPKDSGAWFELGTSRYQLGDYEGSEEALKRAVELDTVSINALHNLGVLYQDQANYKRAEEVFREMVRRHPNLPDGYIRLAELYRPGNYKESGEEEKILLLGLRAMEKNTILLLALAEYYERNKLYDQALTTYQKILSLDPPNAARIEEEIARLEMLQ